ncbi:MAG TPA: DUF1588 domain-containing protein [Polyangiaceae bacterium]|nr:DUF1588 domain-containing protein [Polyangiaceae bacterium]
MDRRLERKSSFFSARLGFLSAIGTLALTFACVSGSIGGAPNQRGNDGAPSGGAGQLPGNGQAGGQQPGVVGGGANAQGPSALPVESSCANKDTPGPRVLRRLTASEFAASIVDLFGDKSVPVAPVFNDSRVLGFTVDSATLLVQDLNADQLMTNAEAVADWAVTNKPAALTQFTQQCSTLSTDCAQKFIQGFGRKAFRRAVGSDEIAPYRDLFMAEASFDAGVSAVISAMLQSPNFLYRSEIGAVGASGPTFTLTPYEVASSLSYLLTGSMPDDTLLKAADAAQTNNTPVADMVKSQADRLLALPVAQDALMNFMGGWLGLDRLYTNVKDDNVQKLSTDQRDQMAMQTRQLILGVWGGSTGNTVGDLFRANGGILTQQSILIGYARADTSSPTQRGHLVRSRLLCQDVPAPPAGLDTKFTPRTDLKTTRDQYLEGHAAPDHQPCYGCHKLMDPIGVAFEHYDGFGNHRDQENGVTIDATGTIYAAKDGDIAIDGLASDNNGLQAYLSQSDEVKKCLVRYWSYYAFGSASWAQDSCTYDAIRTEAASKSYSLQGVLMGILKSPNFTARVKDQ